jgi:hypothetical protein
MASKAPSKTPAKKTKPKTKPKAKSSAPRTGSSSSTSSSPKVGETAPSRSTGTRPAAARSPVAPAKTRPTFVPRAMASLDDDDVLMANGGGGAGFGRCGGRLLSSKLEQTLCNRLGIAGVVHSHSPRHYESPLRRRSGRGLRADGRAARPRSRRQERRHRGRRRGRPPRSCARSSRSEPSTGRSST